ncbi:MAG: PDZ domain-containing protein [Rubripirellula sp.]|nr:PDZ domain-containing protein [Rubripirellula sp.]
MARSYCSCLVILLLAVAGNGTLSAQATEEKPISYWVSQLGSDQYLRRELANKKLREAGPAAVAPLIEATRSGELELVEQAMTVITSIALSTAPKSDGGAWDQLSQVAAEGGGRRASRAKSAVEEIRDHRSTEARRELAAAGIFVGVDEFAIGAISRPVTIVQIDEKWRGNAEALQWLAWLSGVENARIKGAAVQRDVLKAVAQIPDLVSLVIIDGTVENNTLIPLIEMERIEALEFRYVRLSDEQADLIASIPIRKSLSLMGTGLSEAKAAAMGTRLPGLEITHRQGGFLGVSCLDGPDQCEISSVVPGSAAEAAGLIRDDVIIGIEDAKVVRFKDLQKAVNQHIPGDEVEVRFRRGGEIQTVKLRLRRLEES